MMKKKTIANLLAFFLAISTVVGFSSCKKEEINLVVTNTDCTPKPYREYLALTDESDMAKLLTKKYGMVTPVPTSESVVLSWEAEVAASQYEICVSKNADLSDPCYKQNTTSTSASVGALLPGTYYWKVTDYVGEQESKIGSFVVDNYVRALNVDEVINFRDLGGWKTESGKTIKYGLTYRCGKLNPTSGSALNDLGIKWEIDLRAGSDYVQSVISEGFGIQYLQAGIMQGDYVLKDKSFYSMLTPEQIEEKRHGKATFKQEYATALYNAFKLYTDESNYPIVFHCTSGADRTGTFAFLLAGMLGVEVGDLYRDFELTNFAKSGKRYRSNIKIDENGNYYFNDDGYVTVSGNYVAIGLLYKGLMTCYSTGDGKLSSAIKNYLKKDVGLTDADFAAIENLMLA